MRNSNDHPLCARLLPHLITVPKRRGVPGADALAVLLERSSFSEVGYLSIDRCDISMRVSHISMRNCFLSLLHACFVYLGHSERVIGQMYLPINAPSARAH